MKTIKQFFLATLLSAFSFMAHALVIEQAPLGGGNGNFSVGSAGSQIATDDFQFANDVLLTDISWWGSYDTFNAGAVPATKSFTVRIFKDDGSGNPEINHLFNTSYSGSGDSSAGLVDSFQETVFQHDKSVSWSLLGGVNYYLSIFSNDGIIGKDWYWLESSAGNGTGWGRAADVDSWDPHSSALNMSFRLTATPVASVPEPTTLLLMLIPLLWFVRRFSY